MLPWLRRQIQPYSSRVRTTVSQESPRTKERVRDHLEAQEDPTSRVRVRISRVPIRRDISRTKECSSSADSRELVTIVTRLGTERPSAAAHPQQASRVEISSSSIRTAFKETIRVSSWG